MLCGYVLGLEEANRKLGSHPALMEGSCVHFDEIACRYGYEAALARGLFFSLTLQILNPKGVSSVETQDRDDGHPVFPISTNEPCFHESRRNIFVLVEAVGHHLCI